ncbi:MAG: tyrosine-type recombinase/integrase [Clostridiales bacterium]|nr:tyrosine-type recombinase/integrase [Clostridiales bacterium]
MRVQRSEDKHRDKETDKWTVTVKDYTKSDAGDRDLIIPSTAQKTLAQIVSINPDGEYLFEREGKRLRGITFNKRLTRICDELNIPHRTPHKIRKTYGTTLIDSNVEDGFIAEQMGHKDISTTRKLYYFSNKNRQHKETQIENAISF